MSINIDFISKIYNNRNSYAEVFEDEDIEKIHVKTSVEQILHDYIIKRKLILLTGNPGDGKTHLIRSLKKLLDKYNAYIVLDVNEVKDYENLLKELNEAIKDNRPCILAINEYPLISLLEEVGDRFPYYHEILQLRETAIIYNNRETTDNVSAKVAIVDLNNRNLLQHEVLRASLNKLIGLCGKCESCTSENKCDTEYNISALSKNTVQERLFDIISMLGNAGTHVVMRDILGFLSYIITAGLTCKGRRDKGAKYYNLIFDGNNELFENLKQFDPFQFTHPEIDEKLWNGLLKEGWLLDIPNEVPNELEDEEKANDAFISNKRKFFFENERGNELLSLIPIEYQAYFNLLKQAYDREQDMIQQVVLAINKFFNTDEIEDEKLRVWITHKYELRNHPNVAVSNKSFSLNEIQLLVPRQPKHLEKIEFVPDHFLFRVDSPRTSTKVVDLKIDLNFFKILHLISEGYPPQIVPDNYKFKLYRFMNELAALQNRGRSNEFTIRDMSSNYSYTMTIKDNKFQPKRR